MTPRVLCGKIIIAPNHCWGFFFFSRLFQPVQYGQKPEGKMVTFPSAQVQRATSAATVAQQTQVRGRSPMTTVSTNQGEKRDPSRVSFLVNKGGWVPLSCSSSHPPSPVTNQSLELNQPSSTWCLPDLLRFTTTIITSPGWNSCTSG